MFRICDADALMIPGTTVYYVVKQDPSSKEEFQPIVLDEPLSISAHREIDMIVVHDDLDTESGRPILTYVVKSDDAIHYKPEWFTTITLKDFIELLEYDDNFTIIEAQKPGIVSAISIYYDPDICKNVVHIETADVIIQPAL